MFDVFHDQLGPIKALTFKKLKVIPSSSLKSSKLGNKFIPHGVFTINTQTNLK